MSPTVSLNDSDAGRPGIVRDDLLHQPQLSMKMQSEIEIDQSEARGVAFELNRPTVHLFDSDHQKLSCRNCRKSRSTFSADAM